jgi:tetratricopeptide (TPR) repeat protein
LSYGFVSVGFKKMKYLKTLLLLLMAAAQLQAQYSAKNNDAKLEADYYLMTQDYPKALKLYLNILKSEPENADMKYKTGICYLNSENDKALAVKYLEEAAGNISKKYNASSFKEMNAPPEAMFLLGSAYRVENRLDEAISSYRAYKDQLDPKDDYNNTIVDQYIKSCTNATEMQQSPLNLQSTNLGGTVNTAVSNLNPVISGDGRSLAYTSIGTRGFEIYYVTKKDTGWGKPLNITSLLGSVGKYLKTSGLSYDGSQLFLAYIDPFDSEIYQSKFNRGRWSRAEKLEKPVNGKTNEIHCSISSDGKTLYFVSDRSGGEGDFDIYKTTLNSKGEWGKPLNLGPSINTLFREDTPFISADGNTLYFSSEGHAGMGGLDIFRADLTNPGSEPENMGYPINNTDNNTFYVPSGDGNSGYYSMKNQDSYGGFDIYEVSILQPDEPLNYAEAEVQEDSIIETVNPDYSAFIVTEEPEFDNELMESDVLQYDESLLASLQDIRPLNFVQEKPQVSVEETSAPEKAVATVTAAEVPAPVEEPVKEIPAANLVNSGSGEAFMVQIAASTEPLDLKLFGSVEKISVTFGKDEWYRYACGPTTDISQAEFLMKKFEDNGFGDAFIESKPFLPNYTIQVMAVPGPVVSPSFFKGLPYVTAIKGPDIFCRYTTGEYATIEEARAALEEIRKLGFPKAFIKKIQG